MTVAKFGGSVIGVDGSSIPDIVRRIETLAESAKVIAVFSAPPTMHNGKSTSLTDITIMCGEAAERDSAYDASAIRSTYDRMLATFDEQTSARCRPLVDSHMEQLVLALDEAVKTHSFSNEVRSRALAYSGELLMSQIMGVVINNGAQSACAASFEEWPIITDENIESTNFMRDESAKASVHIAKLVRDHDIVTIGGFVGRTRDGTITTYERGGSDRTAADIGILFSKDYDILIDLEKDSSVASADPHIVDSADDISHMSYNEARIAGMFGMKILDPIAIKEMYEYAMDIPVTITDMKNPSRVTRISLKPETGDARPLKIVTGKSDCAIVGMESGAASELLMSLQTKRRYEEYVVLSPYTHSGLEYTRILFLDGQYVRRNERYVRKFDPFCTITYNRGVITLIGDEMSRAQHVVSSMSACIGDVGLNILNIDAQEETSRIIAIVDDTDDSVTRAIRAIHDRRADMA